MPDCIPLRDPSANAPGEPSCPLDLAYLDRYTLGDTKLQEEVLELFAGQLASSLAELRAASTADEWLRAAHTLKGSSLAVGAKALAASLQEAENLSDANDVGWRHAALARIELEAANVAAFLKTRCR